MQRIDGFVELENDELIEIQGGGLCSTLAKYFGKYIFKITDNGTLLDGIKGNTNIDLYLFGKKIF